MSSQQPNTTLYIKNLNDQVNKEELKSQLYALFTTYGKIIDVVAMKGPKMRGQAFLVFTDLAAATSALRSCEGMLFYDKPMHIDYAKAKSYATLKREDPNFVVPNAAHPKRVINNERITTSSAEKRVRDEDGGDGDRKKVKTDKGDDSDDEEMEIDEDEDIPTAPGMPTPSNQLLCTNLPQEVTDGVLTILFQQYGGFKSLKVSQAPTPNAKGEKVKLAHVAFESVNSANAARTGLDGYMLKPGWMMPVAFS